MSAIEFGLTALCRTCGGAGEIRHRRDPEAEREHARRRKQGEDVPPPPSRDPCPACAGSPLLPVADVDAPDATILGRQLAGEETADSSRVIRPIGGSR